MTALLALIPEPIKMALVRALAVIVVASGSYLYGKHEGTQQAAVNVALEASKAYQERAEINDKVLSLDAVALCLELGGLPDECTTELRRLAQNPGQTGNSGLPGRK